MGSRPERFEATIIVEEMRDPEAIFRAIKPEIDVGKRSTVDALLEKGKITIKIEAQDPTALRASLNSILRLLMLLDEAERL